MGTVLRGKVFDPVTEQFVSQNVRVETGELVSDETVAKEKMRVIDCGEMMMIVMIVMVTSS